MVSKKQTKKRTRKSSKKQLTKPLKKAKDKKTQISSSKCAPGANEKENPESCFTFESLVKIAEAWNKDHHNDLIKIPSKKTKRNTQKLWKDIDSRLKSKCETEWCWIEQEFVRRLSDKELSGSFRPKMPKSWKKNKHEWLTTTDINSVMKQYEQKYEHFKFIGPVPIDFDYQYQMGQCIVNELCNIQLADLIKKNIKKLGIVFNLDPHDKPGSHWVALYLDLVKNKVYYFDSYGMEPPTEVLRLVERIKSQGQDIGKDIGYEYNQTRHQYKNSECGVYSMHFITQLLEGRKSFNGLQNQRIDDEKMNRKRKFFFIDQAVKK